MTVKQAIAALEANDPVAAVKPLLAAWRTAPSRELADALSRITTLASEKRPPLTGSTRVARGQAWDELAKEAHPADVGVLLEALSGFSLTEAAKRLALLEARGQDPRITVALAALMAHPPQGWRGAASISFWSGALAAFRRMKDTRIRDRLPALAAQWKADRGNAIGRYLGPQLPDLIINAEKWTDGTLPAAEAKSLQRFLAAPSASAKASSAEALAAVFARPADLGARQVLADALVEAGDVRGEFINLQLLEKLTAAQRSRVSALVKQHGRQWLGPLESVIHQSGLRFERGFPVTATVGSRSSSTTSKRNECAAAVGHPHWSTFEELDLEPWYGDRGPLVSHEVMRSLRVVHGASVDVFEPPRPLQLEEVGFSWFIVQEDAARVFASKKLPALRKLRIWPYGRGDLSDEVVWAPFWKSPVMSQLESLTVISPNETTAHWFDLLDRPPPGLQRIAVEASSSAPWAIVFTRAQGEWSAELRYGWNSSPSDGDYARLDTFLEQVKRRVPQVTLDFVRYPAEPSAELRATIDKVLKKRLGAEQVSFIEPTTRPRAGRR